MKFVIVLCFVVWLPSHVLQACLPDLRQGWVLDIKSRNFAVSCPLQHFLRLAGTALSSVGVLDYDADHGNELGILERGQNEQVT